MKTTWNSLCDMLVTFYEQRKTVQFAMEIMNENNVCNVKYLLDEVDMEKVRQLAKPLSILKVARENLCKEDRNLLQAERVVAFTKNKLRELKSAISQELIRSFENRIAERRGTRVVHLLEYL